LRIPERATIEDDSMPEIPLKTGDILLMLSKGEVSALIAWMGDSIYSHSAMVADHGDIIEAVGSGVTRSSLAALMQDQAGTFFVDVFPRLDRVGMPLSETVRHAVLRSAEQFDGTPFEYGKLVQIGVISAVRQKLPQHWLARLLIREALDLILERSQAAMTCSQFVYTSMLLADLQPQGCAAPRIIVPAPTSLPFPDIDWPKFAVEARHLLEAAKPRAAIQFEHSSLINMLSISDEELTDRAEHVRLHLGISGQLTALAHGTIIVNPNPKLITPQDLANSPDSRFAGRLVEFA
jgi:hypothetical protein